ncbi:MAG TPA: class I SAM-dependent methyltransferase, partial [Acidimicrobiales bacterium]|nr:class I SAM-dependent methyltransferase [Acidimicrobiales bacterium]
SPYQWLAEALPPGEGSVLDLACGSAPLASDLSSRGWVGVDLSLAELARARPRGGAAMAQADAAAVPVATSSVPAVVCSMGLMVLQPLPAVAAELVRVLVPGGTLVALVPATFPLTMGDVLRTARLLAALSRWRLSYPNEDVVRRPRAALAALGLQVISDERRRFVYPVATRAAAARLVHSLYLPGVGQAQVADARQVVDRWVGTEVGVPLRRLVARAPA